MTEDSGLQVIATTISGSIKDWGKVEKIVPLFGKHGRDDVTLQTVDSHREARDRTRELVKGGCRYVISAGGSGTFNSVLEGCIDAGVDLGEVTLGFLRKGSADLIGKVLGMPDEIEAAIGVFVESLAQGHAVPCDVIRAESFQGDVPPRHFVGYGGAEILGRVPHFTENRFMKYYKGILSQLFGDLGPFFVGASLASMERIFRQLAGQRRLWSVQVDGEEVSKGGYQAMIIVNGDLGKDLPFARDVPLGSGDFHLFGLKDVGVHKLPGQFKRAFDSSIQKEPERWGFEHHRIEGTLSLVPSGNAPFPVNVDGSTMKCRGSATFRIVDQIRLMARG
jgi:diacylglycerol kinase family enzyme